MYGVTAYGSEITPIHESCSYWITTNTNGAVKK